MCKWPQAVAAAPVCHGVSGALAMPRKGASVLAQSPVPLSVIPAGKTEQKEHLLDERDPLYVELRHQHFAAASLKISGMMDEFTQQNRVSPGSYGS